MPGVLIAEMSIFGCFELIQLKHKDIGVVNVIRHSRSEVKRDEFTLMSLGQI